MTTTLMATRGSDPSPEEKARGERFARLLKRMQAAKAEATGDDVTGADIARATGISTAYIGVLRRGGYDQSANNIKRPSEAIVRKLQAYLGGDLSEWMEAAGWVDPTLPARERVVTRAGDSVILIRPEDGREISDEELRLWRAAIDSAYGVIKNLRQ